MRGAVGSAVLATLGAFVLALVELTGLVGQPSAGFFFLANGDVGPRLLTAAGAAPEVALLRPQDRLVAIDGVPVAGGADAVARIAAAPAGTPLRYTFLRSGAARFHLRMPTLVLTWSDAADVFGPFLMGGLLLVALTGLVVALRPGDVRAVTLFVMGVSMGAGFGVLMVDGFLGYRLGPELQLLGLAGAKASILHLALLWPERRWPVTRWPRRVPALLYGAMVAQAVVYRIAYLDAPRFTTVLAHVSVATFVAALLLLVANIARTAWAGRDADQRRATRVVLLGPALGVAVGVLLFVNTWFWTELRVPPLLYLLPIWVTIAAISYAIVRHNLFELDGMARRALALAIQGGAVAVAYLVTLTAVQSFTGGAVGWTSATLFAAALLVAVPAAGPLRRRAESAAASLFPRQLRAAEVIHRASRELVRVRGQDELAHLLRDAIAGSTGAERVRVLLARRGEPLRERGNGSEAPLPADCAIAAAVALGTTVDLQDPGAGPPRALRAELEAQGAVLLVPLPAGAGGGGAFLLGPRAGRGRYTAHDRRLLETLAAQSSVAIENAHAWEEVRSLEQRLSRENLYLREELELRHDFQDVVGNSEAIRAVLAQIERVAPTGATVLVIGETGTGKELAVRSLHALSTRRDRMLVKMACAAIPESLIESELFGHERGAFTGATQAKPGRFEVADGGTLFFDDVDTLPLAVQAKLLRAIQEGEFQRVGSNAVRHVDVRIVAATNKDLLAEVRAGRFREDLYYRLHVVPIRLPALRDRPEDIPLLVQHFIERESPRLGRRITAVAADAMEQLQGYSWPGNIRELRNVIERALVMTSGEVLRLPDALRPGGAGATRAGSGSEIGTLPFAELVRRKKIEWIRAALEQTGGNQRRAAELLGLHRPSLTRMIRELGIRETPAPGARHDASGATISVAPGPRAGADV